MRIAVHEVSKGRKGHALPPTTLSIETGHARFVLAETELRPTVLGLIATGRMRPDTGEVTIDGARNDRDLRRRMALVDAPEVSDPHPGVTLAAVVGEELMFAGLPATPLHARRWLEQIGFAELAAQPIGTIKPSVRVRVMAELAVLRDDVEGFVLVSPDRHGGRPEGWWRIATEFAERGFAVLVIVGGSAAAVIERLPEALETDYPSNATVPVRPLADVTGSTHPLVVERAKRDETPHPHEHHVSSRSASPSSLNDPVEDEPAPHLDDERTPPDPDTPGVVERAQRDETPHPQEHHVSSPSPAASSLNDHMKAEPAPHPDVERTPPEPDTPGVVERAQRDETPHPHEHHVSSPSASPSSLNDHMKDEPAPHPDVERAQRDETPHPHEHHVSSPSPAASSLNDPVEDESTDTGNGAAR